MGMIPLDETEVLAWAPTTKTKKDLPAVVSIRRSAATLTVSVKPDSCFSQTLAWSLISYDRVVIVAPYPVLDLYIYYDK